MSALPAPALVPPKKAPAVARQMNWISGDVEPAPPEQIDLELPFPDRTVYEDAVSILAAENGSQVLVHGFGVSLGKKSERLVVRLRGKPLVELPLHDLQHVHVVSKGVSLSSDLVQELGLRGVKLAFATRGGEPVAMLSSPTHSATVAVRRAQMAAEGNGRGMDLARAIVVGKLRNQEKLLRYFAKGQRKTDADRAGAVERGADTLASQRAALRPRLPSEVKTARAILMGTEGAAARVYWACVAGMLDDVHGFGGRRHRGARDPVNSALNYGYGILYAQMWSAVLNTGLEPFAGFLHVDRSGKPSLVLDLVEEFRQPVVDRAILGGLHLGKSLKAPGGRLDADSREWIAQRVLARLTSTEVFGGKRYELRSILQMQARAVASFLRGSRASYRPFTFRWRRRCPRTSEPEFYDSARRPMSPAPWCFMTSKKTVGGCARSRFARTLAWSASSTALSSGG